VTCDLWDVVVVPFPFTEKPVVKRRPALVVSRTAFNQAGHTVFAMITTKMDTPRPSDVEIKSRGATGLTADCVVRLKVFTLDNRLIVQKVGALSPHDQEQCRQQIDGCIA